MCEYKWRDIETAPRDGERVIVAYGGRVDVAVWSAWTNGWHGPCDQYGDSDEIHPTHWMPLPEPPK